MRTFKVGTQVYHRGGVFGNGIIIDAKAGKYLVAYDRKHANLQFGRNPNNPPEGGRCYWHSPYSIDSGHLVFKKPSIFDRIKAWAVALFGKKAVA